MRLLIYNCQVLIGESKYETIKDGAIVVNDSIIEYVGEYTEEIKNGKYDQSKDMHGYLVMPGFVNAHGHSAMTLLRGVGANLSLQDWLFNAIFPREDKLEPRDIYYGDLLATMEMLSSGTTTVADMYDFPYAGLKAYSESGLRTNLCRVGLCFDPEFKDLTRYNQCVGLVETLKNGHITNEEAINEIGESISNNSFNETINKAIVEGRITADFCLHSEYLTNEKFVKAIVEANETLKARMHIHVSETKSEHEECKERHNGMTPIEYLDSLGVFKYGAYCAHCVWITENDMKIMADKNVSLIHNPISNMKLGSGFSPIAKAASMGVNVCLGTYGCASNNNLSMFEEIKVASLLNDVYANPDNKNYAKVDTIAMATKNGGIAIGRNDIGMLKAGYKADITVLDLNDVNLFPINDIGDLIKYSATSANVKMTMVDGKILYENGEYYTIDREKVFHECKKIVEKL